ncbi:MAG: glycosyltransferase [Akkermansiaceae bacterium]|nr:glycosyltransferase [Akkermansiaceae bacterium]
MHLVHLTQSASSLGGGIAEAVRALSVAVGPAAARVTVMSARDEGSRLDPWPPGCPVLLDGIRGPGMMILPGLVTELAALAPDLLHIHGLWTWFSLAVPGFARRRNIPYVVSPHGMLDAWALQRSAWKKRIAGALFERRSLRGASCLHALCRSEAASMRAYGLRRPVAVIPNGVEIRPEGRAGGRGQDAHGKLLLFLGRLHPKKGLANALRAWKAEAGRRKAEEWRLVIAGWDQEGHGEELKRLCDELDLRRVDIPAARLSDPEVWRDQAAGAEVVFTGPAFGTDKEVLLDSASAFILPSFSEGLPVAVLEAWAHGLPALLTDHCNLPEGFEAGAAMRITTDMEGIAAGIRALTALTGRELEALGRNGLSLAESRFAWPTVARRMVELYQWLLGGGPPPGFVDP